MPFECIFRLREISGCVILKKSILFDGSDYIILSRREGKDKVSAGAWRDVRSRRMERGHPKPRSHAEMASEVQREEGPDSGHNCRHHGRCHAHPSR